MRFLQRQLRERGITLRIRPAAELENIAQAALAQTAPGTRNESQGHQYRVLDNEYTTPDDAHCAPADDEAQSDEDPVLEDDEARSEENLDTSDDKSDDEVEYQDDVNMGDHEWNGEDSMVIFSQGEVHVETDIEISPVIFPKSETHPTDLNGTEEGNMTDQDVGLPEQDAESDFDHQDLPTLLKPATVVEKWRWEYDEMFPELDCDTLDPSVARKCGNIWNTVPRRY